ncbi:MAG: hypothetical protein HEQ39_09535 [Rhizobacter sp.]
MTYKPQDGSLAARTLDFFRKHPDEELSGKDIAQKFDAPSSSITNLLVPSLSHGMLIKGKDEAGSTVYRAGPKLNDLPEDSPPTGFKGWLAKKGQSSAEGRRSPVQMPDPDALLIEPNIPIPPPGAAQGQRYAAVFARMNVGDSFGVATDACKRLTQTAQSWGKSTGRKFAARQVDQTTSRIWRIE